MNYYEAIGKCINRYIEMYDGTNDMAFSTFMYQARYMIADRVISLEKANRWLGYIQGVLIERGYTNIQTERDWTRPLFESLDELYSVR